MTVTGIAPWATQFQSQSQSLASSSTATPPSALALHMGTRPSLLLANNNKIESKQLIEAKYNDVDEDVDVDIGITRRRTAASDESNSGITKLKLFMSQCMPDSASSSSQEANDQILGGQYGNAWTRAQAAATPTLRPSLKLHDLVFGQDLGSGAFSVVRYAREIDRNSTRSSWAEYAVKVISASKIAEHHYAANVEREIAILQMLCHPGIARLISSFR